MPTLSASLRTAVALTLLSPMPATAQSESTAKRSPTPPTASKKPHPTMHFGETLPDDYFWLRDRNDPNVTAYLRAENDYTNAVMGSTEELQTRLHAEMIGRLKQEDESAPVRIGEYFYYHRMERGKQYAIHCRRHGSMETAEQVLLDENKLAAGHTYFVLGPFRVSPDHRYLAYSVDVLGNERFTLFIKDLESGATLQERIENTYDSLEWSNDSRHLFYNTVDAANRPFQLHRHTVGTAPHEDSLVHHEMDEAFFVTCSKTRSRRFLLLQINSNTTSEVRYLEAQQPTGKFRIIYPRQTDVQYSVDHNGDSLFIATNADGATNFALVQVPIHAPTETTTIIPHRESVKLDRIDLFENHLVASERENGLTQLRVLDLHTRAQHVVEQPEAVYMVSLDWNPVFATQKIRFHYTSIATPDSIFEYDMKTRLSVLLKEDIAPGSFDRSEYETARIWATASDGAKVPISLAYRKGMNRDGHNPVLLEGYGAYGISFDPEFDSSLVSLLDRGFIYAIAHVRGGGDLGRPWYDAGKMDHKRNTFTDFIACAEHLIAAKYTSPSRLAITGTSAGGLLIGSVLNMRPELFHAAIAKVPFVDVINTMVDETIPLTVIEWEEWGNPRIKDQYLNMRSYSPYDNVEKRDYPNLLITAGLNDPRVGYWEPAKWTARLRAKQANGNLILLKTDLDAGHGGHTGRFAALKDRAFEAAFLIERMKLAPAP